MGLRRFIGTASQRAASSKTGTAGDLFYDSDTNAFGVADGTTLLANLKRFLRLGEAEPAITRGAAAGTVPVLQSDGTLALVPVSLSNAQIGPLGTEVGLPFVEVDVAGRMVRYVASDGTTVFPKAINVPNGSIPLAQLATAVQAGIGQGLAAELGIPMVFADANNRLMGYFAADGTLVPLKFTAPAGSISLSMLAPAVQAGLPGALATETGLLEVRVDSNGRQFGVGVRADGSVFGKGIAPAGGAVDLDATWLVDTIGDSNGNSQIRSTNRATGACKQLTTVGRNVEPRLAVINGVESVIYRTDSGVLGGKYTKWFIPADGSAAAQPVFSLTSPFYADGDSLTAATNSNPTGNQAGGYPYQLAVMLGVSHVNLGSGGQNANQISARVGGTPATVTFSSNTIAATTSAQTVTVSVDLYYGGVGAFSDVGTIAGVHGRLASGGTSGALTAYTFTRDTAGTAVVLSGATNFIPDVGIVNATQMTGIWQGRNGYFTMAASQIVADDQSIIDHLTPLAKRYWVLAIPPWQGEETTTPANMAPGGVRKALDDANIAKAANAGTFWVNSTNLAGSPLMIANPGLSFAHSYQFLQTSLAFTIANARYPACPATPTTQDATDITNGIIPTSFRTNTSTTAVDPGHLNEYGYYLMAYVVYQFIIAKGWLL